jgi:hypothetical protein
MLVFIETVKTVVRAVSAVVPAIVEALSPLALPMKAVNIVIGVVAVVTLLWRWFTVSSSPSLRVVG